VCERQTKSENGEGDHRVLNWEAESEMAEHGQTAYCRLPAEQKPTHFCTAVVNFSCCWQPFVMFDNDVCALEKSLNAANPVTVKSDS